MSRRNDAGESSASIRARHDEHRWPQVRAALENGATIYRPTGLRDFYTQCRDDRDALHGLGVSHVLVKRLEAEGVLRVVGVDRYGLVPKEAA